jgi:hypothetical protein
MDKLDHLGWVVSASFAIGDARFAIRSTSHAFGEWVTEALGAYEVEDVEDFTYSVVVPEAPTRGAKEFLILYRGSSAMVRTLDPVTLGRSLLAELETIRFHERDDAVYVLASMAEVGGVPILIPSSLLPTLAKLGRRASRLGFRVPGQRAVAIDIQTATVAPIDSGLDVSDRALESLAAALPWEGQDGLCFTDEPAEVGALVAASTDAESSLEPVRKAYGLSALTSSTVNFQRVGGRGLEALGRLVERAPCYRSTWTDPRDVLSRLNDAIGIGT